MSESVYHEIFNYFNAGDDPEISEVTKYFNEMCQYNIIEGKQIYIDIVVGSYNHLSKSSSNPENIKLARVLGCCVQILYYALTMHDDMMDNGLTRENRRCWYLMSDDKGFGLMGINDGLYLTSMIPKILKKYFQSTSYYAKLLELFSDVLNKTCMGQCLNMIISSKMINWDNFTMNRHKASGKFRLAYCMFYLPVAAPMILAGESNESVLKQAENILLKIGEYFTIQDDYIDCYGDPAVYGRIGTDISEGQCTWFAIQTINLADEYQKSRFKENYGKKDNLSISIVKDIYNELQLGGLCKICLQDLHDTIIQMINELDKGDAKHIPKEIFTNVLEKVSERLKNYVFQ